MARRTATLWCAHCRALVDVEGTVYDAAPTATIHVTPADWIPHRRTHTGGAR